MFTTGRDPASDAAAALVKPATPDGPALRAATTIANELRDAYFSIAAALVVLEKTSTGSAHPALRAARRHGEDALELAADAQTRLGAGIQALRERAGPGRQPAIRPVAETFTAARVRLVDATGVINQLPDRIRTAGRQLPDDEGTEAVADDWAAAATDLSQTAASLMAVVTSLATFTDILTDHRA